MACSLADHIDHPSNGHVAPKGGVAPSDDFNAFDVGQGDFEPLRGQIKRIHHRHAIQKHQHFGVSKTSHFCRLTRWIRLCVGHPCEIETRYIFEHLIQGAGGKSVDVFSCEDGRVQGHLLELGLTS